MCDRNAKDGCMNEERGKNDKKECGVESFRHELFWAPYAIERKEGDTHTNVTDLSISLAQSRDVKARLGMCVENQSRNWIFFYTYVGTIRTTMFLFNRSRSPCSLLDFWHCRWSGGRFREGGASPVGAEDHAPLPQRQRAGLHAVVEGWTRIQRHHPQKQVLSCLIV